MDLHKSFAIVFPSSCYFSPVSGLNSGRTFCCCNKIFALGTFIKIFKSSNAASSDGQWWTWIVDREHRIEAALSRHETEINGIDDRFDIKVERKSE